MSVRKGYQLATNAGAGNGTAVTIFGGTFAFVASATWSAGNVKLQMQARNGNWYDVANSTLSADGHLILQLPAGQLRAVITTSSAVYADLVPVPTNN